MTTAELQALIAAGHTTETMPRKPVNAPPKQRTPKGAAPMPKQKRYFLLTRYPDGRQTYERIKRVSEEGLTVIPSFGMELTLSAQWINEHWCWLNDHKHPLPSFYALYWKDLAMQVHGEYQADTTVQRTKAGQNKGPQVQQFPTGHDLKTTPEL